MQIANPIYDVVFKYLMEDSKIAKLLISSIIGQDIELIDFSPKEFVADFEKNKNKRKQKLHQRRKRKERRGQSFFSVYRLDFTAKIKTEEGEKVVLIEIQKAKFPSDIMRFRKYLGEQYRKKENSYMAVENGKLKKKACEIISIYFLGYPLDNIKNIPVIKSEKKFIDISTGEEIKQKEYFIDSLNHESYTIVIPSLKEKRRNELEVLLSVFDQTNLSDNDHIRNVKETDFPEKFRELIRRLQKAASEPEIRNTMDAEDEILEELAEIEREKDIEKQEALAQKDLIIEEKEKEIEEKDKEIQIERVEKEKAKQREEEAIQREVEAKQREEDAKKRESDALELAEKERLEKETAQQKAEAASLLIHKMVIKLAAKGFTNNEIAEDLGISENEVTEILQRNQLQS